MSDNGEGPTQCENYLRGSETCERYEPESEAVMRYNSESEDVIKIDRIREDVIKIDRIQNSERFWWAIGAAFISLGFVAIKNQWWNPIFEQLQNPSAVLISMLIFVVIAMAYVSFLVSHTKETHRIKYVVAGAAIPMGMDQFFGAGASIVNVVAGLTL